MKNPRMILTTGLLALASSAWGQADMPKRSDSPMKAPADPGIRSAPDSSMKAPSNSGVIVVPPKTDHAAIATPPRNIDPEIDAATRDIDKKNRKKSQDKQKAR
jgi:hypothetical protein